ncbi:cysteine proteinase inhibitor 5-like [Henckelia pumila]|uniref:cysteine proteinase inhibitor 5-like n=1 Tax=Henckelia pumila TaxID=405737 RepID=UPI003C6E0E00
MASKCLSLLVVVCSILLASASIEAVLGGWQPIKNVTDPKVVEIAEFAVQQHNNMHVRGMLRLRLVSVVRGETQIVDGINYKLVVSAAIVAVNPMIESNYQVVVLDKPWMKERNLISFDKIAP